MTKKIVLSALTILTLLFANCTNDDSVPQNLEVKDFVWKGMNLFYFWQADVADLADDRFSNQSTLNSFLSNSVSPESLFESLLFNTQTVDKFSWIVDDYITLEQQFQGVSKSNGVEFGLVQISGSNDIFGYVRYILPGSDAVNKNIKRGDLFLEVDGQQITIDNYRNLLFPANTSYTLGLASISNNAIALNGETVALTKEEYTENPIFITKAFDIGGRKIGYLMYNAFTSDFDDELNDAFAQLKAEGVTDLVLDLRYNGGGSVRTATQLASMITGQFDELIKRERWNAKLQKAFEDQNPAALINNFTNELSNGVGINSLNLAKLHVLITGSSASASELIINGLNPYIDIKLIGTKTVGKYVASVTLYDSENFTRSGVNPDHTYAMQPIVLEEINNVGENDKDGFDPDILLAEDFENLGTLGDQDEPLLQKALDDILGVTRPSVKKEPLFLILDEIGNSKDAFRFNNEMYITKDLKLKNIMFEHANR